MGAVVRACKSSTSLKNTGTGSNLFPAATAMIFVCSPRKKFTLADLNNPDIVSVFTEWIHADGDEKVYPLFGNQIPISGNTNTKGTDNTVTLDDGQVIFVSYTQTQKLFSTTDGGLCFAKALLSFNNAPMAVIEVDIKGNIVVKDNHDGTYSGLKATLFSPAIDFADLKNPAKSYFQLGYMPDYYVKNAALLQDGTPLLDLIGLMDLAIVDAGGSTSTELKVKIIDGCCGDDVTSEWGQALADADDFIVTGPNGAVIPVTSSAYDAPSNTVVLEGAFAVSTNYSVSTAKPSQLFTDGVEGVEVVAGNVMTGATAAAEAEGENTQPEMEFPENGDEIS